MGNRATVAIFEHKRQVALGLVSVFRRRAASASQLLSALQAGGAPPALVDAAVRSLTASLPTHRGGRYPRGGSSSEATWTQPQVAALARAVAGQKRPAAFREWVAELSEAPHRALAHATRTDAELDGPQPRPSMPIRAFEHAWHLQLELSEAVRSVRYFVEGRVRADWEDLLHEADRTLGHEAVLPGAQTIQESLELCMESSPRRVQFYLAGCICLRCEQLSDLSAMLLDALEYLDSFTMLDPPARRQTRRALELVREHLVRHFYRAPPTHAENSNALADVHARQRRQQVEAYCFAQRDL